MPKYLLKANYVGDGLKGVLKEGGVARRAAAERDILSRRLASPPPTESKRGSPHGLEAREHAAGGSRERQPP